MAVRYLLQYRNQIISVVIILVFGIVMKHTFSYYYREMNELNKEKAQIENRRKLVQEWDAVNKRNKDLENKFFRKDTLIFKRFIEEKARTAGISLDYLSPSHRDATIYWESTIGLKITSSYKEMTEFIKYLEDRNIRVEKIIIRSVSMGRKADMTISGITLKD